MKNTQSTKPNLEQNKPNNELHPHSLKELKRQQEGIQNRFKGNGEASITPISKEYADRLRKKPGEEIDLNSIIARIDTFTARPQKAFNCPIDYEDARIAVWHICKAKSAVIKKEFVVDDHNRGIIQNMIRYFIGNEECKWDLSKGLLLFGDVGRGKTYMMSVMKTFADAGKIEFRRFRFHTCADIADEVELNGNQAMKKYFNSEFDICFDDLGQESATVKRYGNDLNVMERILTKRYNAFVSGKCITHITTNLDVEGIEEMYGTRLGDRFNEMFNLVFFPGESRRK